MASRLESSITQLAHMLIIHLGGQYPFSGERSPLFLLSAVHNCSEQLIYSLFCREISQQLQLNNDPTLQDIENKIADKHRLHWGAVDMADAHERAEVINRILKNQLSSLNREDKNSLMQKNIERLASILTDPTRIVDPAIFDHPLSPLATIAQEHELAEAEVYKIFVQILPHAPKNRQKLDIRAVCVKILIECAKHRHYPNLHDLQDKLALLQFIVTQNLPDRKRIADIVYSVFQKNPTPQQEGLGRFVQEMYMDLEI